MSRCNKKKTRVSGHLFNEPKPVMKTYYIFYPALLIIEFESILVPEIYFSKSFITSLSFIVFNLSSRVCVNNSRRKSKAL